MMHWKKKLQATATSLETTRRVLDKQTEEVDRLNEELENLEQYTRKNSLEFHGIPENSYQSTEEVVLKIAAALEVQVAASDIEISHKLKRKNGDNAKIVKFCSHKIETKLYKQRTRLKNIKASDLFPGYAAAAARFNDRLFINENLTSYRRGLVKSANTKRRDGCIHSIWTIDVLPTVPTAAIVPSLSPVVQITFVDEDATAVCSTHIVERASSAVTANATVILLLVPVRPASTVALARSAVRANASVVCLLAAVRSTPNVTLSSSAVTARASVVSILVPVRSTPNVTVARSAVHIIANASVVCLLVPVRSTPNVTAVRSAVHMIANAPAVCFLVPVRPTTSVTVERIVVREYVRHTVDGAAELLQAL
ncbi:hypothetical protein AWC38_SpisGene9991 [Stylophora pistillata]|uniref:Uncharacterized protein n=1 Tax=Stylophora pistillata TaxID=50429 RepID=A0A2B4SA29_STYPI|nr:hypothetical protein AWC38_SpisGene9991 [Stylophora pistillata]